MAKNKVKIKRKILIVVDNSKSNKKSVYLANSLKKCSSINSNLKFAYMDTSKFLNKVFFDLSAA